MTIEHAKEANLRPLNVKVDLVLRLQDVQNNGDAILVVVTDDTLVRVGRIRFNDTTLLLTCLRRLVVLQLYRLGVQRCWVLAKEQRLHFNELDVGIALLLA